MTVIVNDAFARLTSGSVQLTGTAPSPTNTPGNNWIVDTGNGAGFVGTSGGGQLNILINNASIALPIGTPTCQVQYDLTGGAAGDTAAMLVRSSTSGATTAAFDCYGLETNVGSIPRFLRWDTGSVTSLGNAGSTNTATGNTYALKVTDDGSTVTLTAYACVVGGTLAQIAQITDASASKKLSGNNVGLINRFAAGTALAVDNFIVDNLAGAAARTIYAVDWPNPVTRCTVGVWATDAPANRLLNLLRSQDKFFGPAGYAQDFDWPNPVLRKDRGQVAITATDAPGNRLLNLLASKDTFFSGAGRAPAFDWPNPVRRDRSIVPVWATDASSNRLLNLLASKDAFFRGAGYAPAFDWPNPILRRDRGQVALEATLAQRPSISLTSGVSVTVTSAALTLTGQSVAVNAKTNVAVSAASLSLTGQTVGIDAQARIAVTPAALTLTGQTVVFNAQQRISVTPAALTLAGQTVGIDGTASIAVTAAPLTLTGQTVDVTNTGGEVVALPLPPTGGGLPPRKIHDRPSWKTAYERDRRLIREAEAIYDAFVHGVRPQEPQRAVIAEAIAPYTAQVSATQIRPALPPAAQIDWSGVIGNLSAAQQLLSAIATQRATALAEAMEEAAEQDDEEAMIVLLQLAA